MHYFVNLLNIHYITDMKKNLLTLVVAVICMMSFSSCGYNDMVEKEQEVEQSWAEVQNQYQRRADLIPNLVNTVKGYASHESSTLENVVKARAAATSINLNVEDLNDETLAKYQQAQGELSQALKSLLAVTEAYPDLKANENFRDLQTQLEGTENRVTVARGRYTEAVKDYNTKIKKFPEVIYAGWFGFEKKPQFQAEVGAERAPEVNFD